MIDSELRNVRALSREVRLEARLLVPVPDAMVVVEVVVVEVVVKVAVAVADMV